MRKTIKRFILITLNQCDGVPCPETALVQATRNLSRPDQPTVADVLEALKDVEAEGFVTGLTDSITGREWVLTNKGQLKARQLQ